MTEDSREESSGRCMCPAKVNEVSADHERTCPMHVDFFMDVFNEAADPVLCAPCLDCARLTAERDGWKMTAETFIARAECLTAERDQANANNASARLQRDGWKGRAEAAESRLAALSEAASLVVSMQHEAGPNINAAGEVADAIDLLRKVQKAIR
jgi:hypothetical protein